MTNQVKIKRIESRVEGSEEYTFKCPGCKTRHWVRVQGPSPCWTWNGSLTAPTFSPSVVASAGTQHCHSFIRDGQIIFLDDCWHDLKGQTVDLPPLEAA